MRILISLFILFLMPNLAISSPKVWIEKNTKMEFVWIPGGCFVKGCLPQDKDCYFDEKPSKKVCVKGFWMSKYEVTLEQWKMFIKETKYKPIKKDLWGCEDTAKPTFPQSPNHPVVCVNWFDAKAFAKWLTQKTKINFRLPTEIEWEYACKTSNNHLFSCGEKVDGNTANFWSGFGGKSKKDKFKFTSPIGYFSPNEFGIYDLSGNVWEWTEDWYSTAGIPERKDKKIIKGGGWESKAKFLRCSTRKGIFPERNYDTVGFRLVAEKVK